MSAIGRERTYRQGSFAGETRLFDAPELECVLPPVRVRRVCLHMGKLPGKKRQQSVAYRVTHTRPKVDRLQLTRIEQVIAEQSCLAWPHSRRRNPPFPLVRPGGAFHVQVLLEQRPINVRS